MYLTTKQASEIIGCSSAVVHGLVHRGTLTDHHPRANSGDRHEFRLDEGQVRQVAQGYTPRLLHQQRRPAPPAPPPTPAPPLQTRSAPALGLRAFDAKLTRIEHKLDRLIEALGG